MTTTYDFAADSGGVRALAIPGSLRMASRNRGLLRAVAELFGLRDIPLYDGDVEARGYPEPVRRLQDAIRRADALLIATPEYNGSIPGVLENAIDWASRPRSDSALRYKPVAIMGASPGRSRTANAHADLRRVLGATGSSVLDGPAMMVGGRRRVRRGRERDGRARAGPGPRGRRGARRAGPARSGAGGARV